MWPNPQFPADSVTFTEEILNEKLHFFLCSELCYECHTFCRILVQKYSWIQLIQYRNKVLHCLEKSCLYISFLLQAKWNEINFCFDLLIDSFCYYEIFACADVSFWMISFRGSVYLTFITRNEISFLSKCSQWNNTRN